MYRFTTFLGRLAAGVAVIAVIASSVIAEDDLPQLIRQARTSSAQGNYQQAVEFLNQAIATNENSPSLFRMRGQENFKAGNVDASIEDFDRVADLAPNQEKTLWERGISHYYAGRFDDGAKQFELYQTYHDADVENAAWRYLCVARADGAEKARKSILPIEGDRRIPMMKIYAMFKSDATPEDVMATAKAGEPGEAELNQRLFYAHLYIGLFYEVSDKRELAKEHIAAAVKHPIGHYMHDVARVHLARLEKAEKP